MTKRYLGHLASSRRRTFLVGMALTVAFAALGGVASPALATPKGEFAVFADCPLSNPNVEGCLVAKVEKGKIVAGKASVPIEKVQTLQGGFEEENPCTPPFKGKGECLLPFVGAADGNTLSKTPQNVPGGLLGLINCKEIGNILLRLSCELVFENKTTGVTATTELAVPANKIGLSESALLEPVLSEAFGIPALKLPVKVKLDNPFLGSECYLGSNAEPINLNLITGKTKPPPPNKSISGKVGTLESNAEGNILTVRGNALVDNSFSVPGATGCGGLFSFILDPIINGKLGLPSPAGKNTAILEGIQKQAGAEVVKAHE